MYYTLRDNLFLLSFIINVPLFTFCPPPVILKGYNFKKKLLWVKIHPLPIITFYVHKDCYLELLLFFRKKKKQNDKLFLTSFLTICLVNVIWSQPDFLRRKGRGEKWAVFPFLLIVRKSKLILIIQMGMMSMNLDFLQEYFILLIFFNWLSSALILFATFYM